MLKAEKVWPISTGRKVTVAVIDSGVDTSHEQLEGAKIAGGADFLRGNGGGNGQLDCNGHGTAAASLIAAQKIEGVGFQGLAYDAKILPITLSETVDDTEETNSEKRTSPEKYARAIDSAVDSGADVINMSLVIRSDVPVLERAINRALANDVVLVAAAGNFDPKEEPPPPPIPASYDGVIGVSAIDRLSRLYKNSQPGEQVDLAAPGDGVVVANRGGDHATLKGADMAAPFVSAAAALVRSRWPELSADEVARRLFATASPAPGSHEKVGYGLVDPYRALTEELSDEPPVEIDGVEVPTLAPEEVARREEWAFGGVLALSTAGVGVVLAGAMLATLTLLPLGHRRKWRPGRAKPIPEPEEDDMPPAPLRLFEDLEAD
ncbi:MAG: type VII secretion-associated serine protease mycosin [Micromonosporaceae bacterium]